MKKNIFLAAATALIFTFTACQKDDAATTGVNTTTNGTDIPVSTARVKSTSDLHNTNWNYTTSYSEMVAALTGVDLSCMQGFEEETYTFGLSFDGTYAHFTFPENVVAVAGEEGVLDRISAIDYTYFYDGATHTGYFEGVVEDTVGNEVPAQLQFTYDDATDVITFNLPMAYADDMTPITITLTFQRDEEE